MEAALLTAQDKNVLKESRATLSRVLGLDTAGVNKLFEDLGLDTSYLKKSQVKVKKIYHLTHRLNKQLIRIIKILVINLIKKHKQKLQQLIQNQQLIYE